MDSSIIENPVSSLRDVNLPRSSSPFQSPFLQVDPSVIRSPDLISNEFIFPDGSTRPSRGRFEMAFSQIGCSIITGSIIGGVFGFYKGLNEVKVMKESFAVKRSHMLNFITRNGAQVANTFGSLSLIYSALGVGLSFIQNEDDNLNTLIASSTTGALYGALSKTKAMQNVNGPQLKRLIARQSLIGTTAGMIAGILIIGVLNQDNKLSGLLRFN